MNGLSSRNTLGALARSLLAILVLAQWIGTAPDFFSLSLNTPTLERADPAIAGTTRQYLPAVVKQASRVDQKSADDTPSAGLPASGAAEGAHHRHAIGIANLAPTPLASPRHAYDARAPPIG
jgi:hypothetical protein